LNSQNRDGKSPSFQKKTREGSRVEHAATIEVAKAEASEISETHESGEKPLQELRKYPEQLTKPELIEILLELAEN